VFRRNLRQWMLRITAYADRLARRPGPGRLAREDQDDAAQLDRPLRRRARHGSTDAGDELEVFTTRPDTLFGATFMVVAPEHPLLDALPQEVAGRHRERVDRRAQAAPPPRSRTTGRRRPPRPPWSGRPRQAQDRSVHRALGDNPVNGQLIPVFTADYVLMGYGTGAIMAVPGGTSATTSSPEAYDLPIVYTVAPPEGFTDAAWTGDGTVVNSANDEISLDGLDVATAKATITDWLAEHGVGTPTVNYRLRDWLFSRQRYWGEPFPIVYDDHDLPIAIPSRCSRSTCRRSRTTHRAPSSPRTPARLPSRRWAATPSGSR
jgi:leucyl-tRNA synthetase